MAFDEQKFIKYFYALKTMNVYHKELFGDDKDFEVPQLFSQEIVKHFLDLQDYKGDGKIFDAEKDGQYYEIKATSSKSGTTTLNFASKPNVLVWVRFDFAKEEFVIQQFDEFDKVNTINLFYTSDALKNRKSKVDPFTTNTRNTINLRSVNWKIQNTYKVSASIKGSGDQKE